MEPTLVKPGRAVKVKVKEELVSAVVENFISKLSFDCLYFYPTAKADVRLTGSNSSREYQLRDLIFCNLASCCLCLPSYPTAPPVGVFLVLINNPYSCAFT